MKNLLLKFSLFSLVIAAVIGCKDPVPGPDGSTEFALELATVSADYIELAVTSPADLEIAYVLEKKKMAISAAVIFAEGTTVSVKNGDVVKVSENVEQNTSYFLYAAAKLDEQNYSEVFSFEFKTEEYNFDELLTLIDTYYDGYKVHVTVPEWTDEQKKTNVIRYGATSLAWYNVLKQQSGETMTDLLAVIANGNPYGNYIKNDSTIVFNNFNIVELDENGDPVLDELGQQIDIHMPMAPNEPSIFFAGECRWGTPAEFAAIAGFWMPSENSPSIPLFEWDSLEEGHWTGAFQKLIFNTKAPGLLDAKVHVDIPEDEITATDANVYFTMDEGVYRYFYMILDDATYNQVLDVYLDNNEDWYQWFLTSYIAFYEWGAGNYSEDIFVNAASSFYEPLVGGETYHVICTAMGDAEGSTQSFVHKTFSAKEKVKRAPVIEIKAVETGDPYEATFNIKAPNKDVVAAYWACNYAREFELMFNAGETYESLLKGNYTVDAESIAAMNTDEGLTWTFPTLDGETTRLAVYGCNDEYTFNEIDSETEGAGWADYKAPMAESPAHIESDLYEKLAGDWTATATMIINEYADDGETILSRNIDYSSKVTISNEAPYLPDELDDRAYKLYESYGIDREETKGMYDELKMLSEQFTDYRLKANNRLLCQGFLDFDYYEDPGRMTYRSPYDLFLATNYNSYDIAQLVHDFGPKWFLQLREDGTVYVPMNTTYLPPMHAWPGYPFYVGGVGESDGSTIAVYNPDEENNYPGFPVEISSDYNTITIKPIEHGSGVTLYMNALGLSSIYGGDVEIVARVISEITLTRGYTETKSNELNDCVSVPAKAQALTMEGQPVKEHPQTPVYKSMTKLKAAPKREYKKDETPDVVTMDMVNETRDMILRSYNLK